jgi:hypothetical protein
MKREKPNEPNYGSAHPPASAPAIKPRQMVTECNPASSFFQTSRQTVAHVAMHGSRRKKKKTDRTQLWQRTPGEAGPKAPY